MNDKAKQTIEKYLAYLPKELREAIISVDWMNICEEIGKKYKFMEDETEKFRAETLMVLMGTERGELYAKNIEDEIGLPAEEAEKVADEADQRIFSPIYDAFAEKMKGKDPNWQQSIDFVLSGGDYSSFLEESAGENPAKDQKADEVMGKTRKIEEIKDKLNIDKNI